MSCFSWIKPDLKKTYDIVFHGLRVATESELKQVLINSCGKKSNEVFV